MKKLVAFGILFSLSPADQRGRTRSLCAPPISAKVHVCHFPCIPGTLSLDGEILKMSSGLGAARPVLRWALSTSQEPVSPILAGAISPQDSGIRATGTGALSALDQWEYKHLPEPILQWQRTESSALVGHNQVWDSWKNEPRVGWRQNHKVWG